MIQSLEVRMGTFHNVTGVKVGQNCVSILTLNGTEKILPIKSEHGMIKVQGEFGEQSQISSGLFLEGIEPRDITKVDIDVDFVDAAEEFHTRTLHLRSASGLDLAWKLFCEGQPS